MESNELDRRDFMKNAGLGLLAGGLTLAGLLGGSGAASAESAYAATTSKTLTAASPNMTLTTAAVKKKKYKVNSKRSALYEDNSIARYLFKRAKKYMTKLTKNDKVKVKVNHDLKAVTFIINPATRNLFKKTPASFTDKNSGCSVGVYSYFKLHDPKKRSNDFCSVMPMTPEWGAYMPVADDYTSKDIGSDKKTLRYNVYMYHYATCLPSPDSDAYGSFEVESTQYKLKSGVKIPKGYKVRFIWGLK